MKNKSSLTLIEIVLMVMVFLLAAALCVRVFVYSRLQAESDRTVAAAESRAQAAVELLKDEKGNVSAVMERLGWAGYGGKTDVPAAAFGRDWSAADAPDAAYLLYMDVSREGKLGRADVYVTDGKTEVCRLVSSWQED